MNDRFKFRAWNVCDDELKGGMLYDVQNETDFDYFLESKKLVVEQCTGLKDKNGNLIYEGDIVELTDDDSFEKPIKTIVRWAEENACFGLFGSHNLYYGFSSYDSDNFEVIGNIHENGDLLNEK